MSLAPNIAPTGGSLRVAGFPEHRALTRKAAEETAAREGLCRWLGLEVRVRAPEWREVLFQHQRERVSFPRPPDGVLSALDRQPQALPDASTAARAKALLDGLRDSRPRGITSPSVTVRKPRPAPRDALAAWHRRVFLVATGPEALRLLVSAGYLTAGDVEIMQDAYPDGVELERQGAVQGAMAITAAAARGGHEADIPPWLNDQLLTLMGEPRSAAFYQGLYEPEAKPQGNGQLPGARHTIVDQTEPNPSPGERQ